MTLHSTKLAYFSRISACGKVILEVEGKALDSSLFSMFNKRNHAEFVAILAQEKKELQTISTGMRQDGATSTYKGLERLIENLIGFADALSAVCEGLNEKTLSRPYSNAEYMADLNKVEIKRAACELAQARAFD